MNPIQNKTILLGVTGSIAAYKAADLASKLAQAGAQVEVILTAAALQFITPLTFQSVTGRRAYVDADLWGSQGHVQHVGLGKSADLFVIAPATANTLAKLAHGLANDLLSVTALAARCPLLVAPAMDGGMFTHPATQANLEILRQRGVLIVGPAAGHLASGLVGIGRMVEPLELLGQVRLALSRGGPLDGHKVVITAGGTQESVDPVRFISNRSSGKQGFALAQAALDLGAEVTLISGPVALPAPAGARQIDVSSAGEMLAAVLEATEEADALMMAAAVADFRPAEPAANKIKKEAGPPEIRLKENADILAEVASRKARTGFPRVTVGFAAESQDLLDNARAKLNKKRLDLIVANDITALDAGFAVDSNRVTLLFADGRVEALPLMSKEEVAERVLGEAAWLLGATAPRTGATEYLVHLCTQAEWEAALQAGEYRAASLAEDGFMHMSRPGQILDVANRFYRGLAGAVLLWIDPSRLASEVRWEAAEGDIFPHLYGPLNLDAVVGVRPFVPEEDGIFRHLPEL